MELLSSEIQKNSYLYKLLKRGEKAMIYEQTDPELDLTVGFEVFKRKIDRPKVIFGIELGEREIFPGNEDFGKWAWSFSDRGRAMIRFENLENFVD